MKFYSAVVDNIAEENNVSYDIAYAYANYINKMKQKTRRNGRTTYRDSTRGKTYAAENNFMRIYGRGQNFLTVEEAQQFANNVFSSKVWENNKSNLASQSCPTIEYSNKLVRHAGVAYHSRIVLGRAGMNTYILLHELAHTNGHRHHDFSFRRCLVDMVTKFMGKAQGDALKKEFKNAGLKMSVRGTGTVKSFAEWHKTYCRMENARKARKQHF